MAKCPHCDDSDLVPHPALKLQETERCPRCNCLFAISSANKAHRYEFWVDADCAHRRAGAFKVDLRKVIEWVKGLPLDDLRRLTSDQQGDVRRWLDKLLMEKEHYAYHLRDDCPVCQHLKHHIVKGCYLCKQEAKHV